MFSLAMRTMEEATPTAIAAERPRRARSSAAWLREASSVQVAAEEVVGVEAAEHDVGVGERGLLGAAAVTGGARIGTRALRPDLQEPAGIDPADRSAAGADRLRAHGRDGDGQAELDLVLRREERGAVDEQADVAARPAHVEHDAARRVRRARVVARTDRATRDARQEDVGRAPARLARERVPAVALQQRPARAGALRLERLVDAGDVAPHGGLEVRVEDRRGAALVLAPDRGDLVRERDRHVRRRAPRGRRARCRGSGTRRGSTRPPRGRRRRRRGARRRPRAPRRRRAARTTVPSASSRSSMPMQSRRRASGAGLRHAKS